MSFVAAKDISRYQGSWQDTGEPIVLMKIGGGDDGLYFDNSASSDWPAAVAAGKAVGGYWFGGGVQSAVAEAAFFLKGMAPLTEGDVYALDVEAGLAARADVVQWTLDFVTYVHDNIGVWPLVYMNLATLNAHDWSAVLSNCGLWLADWAVSPDATIPSHYAYVMQQYSDGPNYDHDAWFGTVEEFKQYGYHATPPTPAPAVVPDPVVVPAVTVTATPTPGDPATTTEPATVSTVSATDDKGTTSITVTNVPSPQPVIVADPVVMQVTASEVNWLRRLFRGIMSMLHLK